MSFLVKSLRGFEWNHFSKLLDSCLAYAFSIVFVRKFGADEYGVYSGPLFAAFLLCGYQFSMMVWTLVGIVVGIDRFGGKRDGFEP